MFESLRVGVQLTESCNLACQHCSTFSSPKVTTTLDRGYVRDILQQVKQIDPDAEIGFTGGEVFYVRDLLYYAIGLVRELGLSYSVTTNGSWAMDPAERQEVLHSVLDAKKLGLSADIYHGTAVPRRAIGLALQEALELGIEAVIRYTYIEGEDFDKIVEELGLTTEEERARVHFSGVMRVGRAVRLDHSVFPMFPEREPCLAANIVMIRSTGGIFGCCGESMYVRGQHDLRFGHIRDTPLVDVMDNRDRNLVLQTIRTLGARPLAEAAGLVGDSDEEQVLGRSPCGSCHLLLQERNRDKTHAAAEELRDRVNALRALYYGEV
ncbi:radical SAM protein [Streptosporangiaceae bacterium NEAU-GS5]|nr:radical SAM protein [Streptosporangiaceae bacterium NEAU-GS5]